MRHNISVFLVALLPLASAAHAQSSSDRPRIILGASIGIDAAFSTFNAARQTSGLFGTERVYEHSYSDVFKPAFVVGGELGVAVSTRNEMFGRVRFLRGEGRTTAFGESINRSPPGTRINMARFSDYRAVAVEGGVRHAFREGGHLTPFITATGGITFVDAIESDRYCRLDAPECALTSRSTVPALAFLAGVSYPLAPFAVVEAETGLRWQKGLGGNTSGLSVGFLEDAFTGRRISIPISGAIRFRF